MINKYERGLIYVLKSNQTKNIYIGSTTQTLNKRLIGHRKDYKRYLNDKYNYLSSFEIVKYPDCYIELLEKYKCNNKYELYRKEGEYIKKYDCVNKQIAGQTREEYKKINRDKIINKKKIYASKKYLCDCGVINSFNHHARHTRSKTHKKYILNPYNILNHLSF